jgi:hypothetical protein
VGIALVGSGVGSRRRDMFNMMFCHCPARRIEATQQSRGNKSARRLFKSSRLPGTECVQQTALAQMQGKELAGIRNSYYRGINELKLFLGGGARQSEKKVLVSAKRKGQL